MRKGTSVFRCNISQFLTRLEAIFDDYQLTPLTRVTRLPDFCDLIIADYIRTFRSTQSVTGRALSGP